MPSICTAPQTNGSHTLYKFWKVQVAVGTIISCSWHVFRMNTSEPLRQLNSGAPLPVPSFKVTVHWEKTCPCRRQSIFVPLTDHQQHPWGTSSNGWRGPSLVVKALCWTHNLLRKKLNNLCDMRQTGSHSCSSSSGGVSRVLPSTHLQFSRWSCTITEVQTQRPPPTMRFVAYLHPSRQSGNLMWIPKSIPGPGFDPKHNNNRLNISLNMWQGQWNGIKWRHVKLDAQTLSSYWFLLFFQPGPSCFARPGMLTHGTVFHPLCRKCIIVHCEGTIVFF